MKSYMNKFGLSLLIALTLYSIFILLEDRNSVNTRLDALGAENKRLVEHHKVHDKMFEIILAKLYPDHGERLNPPDLDTIGIRWFKPHIIALPPVELPEKGGE